MEVFVVSGKFTASTKQIHNPTAVLPFLHELPKLHATHVYRGMQTPENGRTDHYTFWGLVAADNDALAKQVMDQILVEAAEKAKLAADGDCQIIASIELCVPAGLLSHPGVRLSLDTAQD